ncbi:hypothetical protein [Microbulbifer variabilis]|uniref:hypothetical protein n=1 Tax=Microbulbifer variabilis TaxID=266805 RepID=UPI001CFDB9E0|nr:hypothetical protein [Microbulbifer variabilis]
MIEIEGPANQNWSEIDFYNGRTQRDFPKRPFSVEPCTLSEAVDQYCQKYNVKMEFLSHEEIGLLYNHMLSKKKHRTKRVILKVIRNGNYIETHMESNFPLVSGDKVRIEFEQTLTRP